MKFRFYNIIYFFRLAFQGIFRNGFMSFAAIAVLTSSLLVSGCTWALKVNVDYNLNELNEYNKIVVFVDKDAEEHTIVRLKEKIEAIDSVESVEWITKEEVLSSLFEDYGDYGDILEMYDEDNPCKDELILTYSDPSKVDTIVYRIENMNDDSETQGSVAKINDRRDVATKIDSVKNMASLIFTWLMVLLFLVSVFIIINTIKLAVSSRKDEVSIMRYIGASGFFVSFPFVLEGIILGLFSAVIAFGLQFYIYQGFAVDILGSSGLITVLPFTSILKVLVAIFLGVGIGLGVIGSLISLRKYSRA